MAWKQLKKFNPEKMGSKAGYCLQNTRKGYGLDAQHPSAKAEMEAQKKAGTFHEGVADIPNNCSVPVFVDTSSQYEHVMVYDKGVIYSDGKRVSGSLSAFKCFGWGETLCGVKVVREVAQNASDGNNASGFLPSRGYWLEGDQDTRVARAAAFLRQVFPAYTKPQALSNTYNRYLTDAVKEFQKRTSIKVDGSIGQQTYAKLKEYGFKA